MNNRTLSLLTYYIMSSNDFHSLMGSWPGENSASKFWHRPTATSSLRSIPICSKDWKCTQCMPPDSLKDDLQQLFQKKKMTCNPAYMNVLLPCYKIQNYLNSTILPTYISHVAFAACPSKTLAKCAGRNFVVFIRPEGVNIHVRNERRRCLSDQ